MTPQGKKKVIVIGSLLVIGGIVGYILWKRKKDQESALTDTTQKVEETKVEETKVSGDTKPKPVVVKTTQPISTQTIPKTTPVATAKKVKVDDIMLQAPTKIQSKGVYAISDGSGIYDIMMNKLTGRTRKNEKVGTVTSFARTSSGTYILKGKTPSGDYFSISSTAVYAYV